MKTSQNKLRLHRKKRIRARVTGNSSRPRLAVYRSLTRIEAQVIDDTKGVTLLSADSRAAKAKNDLAGASEVGKLIAKLCTGKKIVEVVFDRGGYKYHGKIKALADAAREGGLKF